MLRVALPWAAAREATITVRPGRSLLQIVGGKRAAAALTDLLNLKDTAQYGFDPDDEARA
jgi:hypothetical protein